MKETQDTLQDIGPQEVERIAQTVQHYHGFDFRNYAPSSFKRRLLRIISLYKLSNTDQLVRRLETDKAFYDEFLHEVTVNTTEMFRDPPFWQSIRTILQTHMQNNRYIYIWHAGVSTGEELFSMLITLKELDLLAKAKLIGTDISEKVLEQAGQGLFFERNLEQYQKNYEQAGGKVSLDQYFSARDEGYYLDPELLHGVKLQKHDLVQDAPLSRYDLVMCRNVLIYFDTTLQDQVIRKFYSSMFKGGFLAIGSKESLVMSSIAHKYEPVDKENKIFQLKRA